MTSPKHLPSPSNQLPRHRLKRWHVRFACWWVHEPAPPPVATQCTVASRLANDDREADVAPVTITYSQIRTLKGRKDFRELVKKLEDGSEGALMEARALFVHDMALAAEIRRWGMVHAREKGDHRAVAQLTEAYIDRFAPKRPDFQIGPNEFTILLTEKQLAREREEPPQTTVERYDAATNSWVDASDGLPSDPLPLDAPLPQEPPRALPPGTMTLHDAMMERRQKEKPKEPERVWDD